MRHGAPDGAAQGLSSPLEAAADPSQYLQHEALESVRTLSLWVAVAYAVFLPTPFLRFPPPTAAVLTALELAAIAAMVLIRRAAQRDRIPLRAAHQALALTLAVPLADILIRSYITYTPDRPNMVALHLIGIGVFCISRAWTTVLLSVTAAGWVPLMWLHPSDGVAEQVIPVAVGGIVGLLARRARLGAIERVEQLRRRDAEHLREARINEAKYREEAGVSAALARVGEALIAALDEPQLLARLCRLTTEVLECDLSHTYLRAGDAQAFTLVTAYGHTPEHEEMLRALRLAPDVQPNFEDFLHRLEREEVIATTLATQRGPLADHGRRHGISHLLHVALRRGDRLIGLHAAGYYGDHVPFTPVQMRIARGLAHLASLALENARLVSELGQASRLKSDFMATMSHELRTPLNVIMGFTDLLRTHTFGVLTPEQMDVLRSIDRNARELLDLISATLDLSRLERGEVPVEIGAVDIGALVHEVRDEGAAAWHQPGRELAVLIPPALPIVRTDRMKLKVVLKNLIGNAAKFTPHGRIDVEVKARPDGLEICVADTGVGIAPDVLPTIFEPFRQGDDSGNRGGVGLGLYIVQRLLDMLGGAVEVESAVGVGSTFRVWLPFAAAGAQSAASTLPRGLRRPSATRHAVATRPST
jgi:signal transduction histidine kinase